MEVFRCAAEVNFKIKYLTVFITITYLPIFTGFTVIIGVIHFQKFYEAERNEF